ncbi:28S ribosomal protein S11, mitochondrial [Xenopus tropicalis]|uniref:Small ribosomal subunit protein uS11m n=1 Tax=Xenopus tropicalis TaxID=8364 RepID=B5DFS9_XENTR|nr:small ribosomal subunit protein uS11m [Xenopus tropicalis]AAI69180.1 Unknown (protein for MGC:189680) [Xenopus tropicalis]|eukprot:NP_001135722.1 28S ribosomal protein S11, mitochondrial [Xenopus tropicalis]
MNPALWRTWKCVLSVGRLQAPGALQISSHRTLHVGVQRSQEASENVSGLKVETESQSSKDFSPVPPLPGQNSQLRWGGKKFEEIPIAHVKATYNNTHIQVTSHESQSLVRTSCGTEGFKNAKKSTAVAAQTAGISAAAKAIGKGVSHVRVVVKGLGPGRLSAIKGLTMGGLEVISITDNTPIPHNGCRPRKARRM